MVSSPPNILGVKVSPLTIDELHLALAEIIQSQAHAQVLHVNVHAFNLIYARPWLRKIFNDASLVFCDGAGVMLAGKILGYHIPQRITYADWTWQLAEFCCERDFSVYFLGARPGVAEAAVRRLINRFPKLKIVGFQNGYFDKTLGSIQNEAVVSTINSVHPDILLVGFGMPEQEKWLAENWPRIDSHVALTGGAVFDYISGNTRRAPRWMTDHGFEWLGRLLIEPDRLWRRYLIGNPLFFYRVFLQRIGLKKYSFD